MNQILEALQINGSLLVQLVIILIFFVLAKALFVTKLKEIITLREDKTKNLSKKADADFEEAEKLNADFRKVIDSAYVEAKEITGKKKEKVLIEAQDIISAAESKAEAQFLEKRKEFVGELEAKKESIFEQANDLSDKLVNKMV